jgi:hypothetical protein
VRTVLVPVVLVLAVQWYYDRSYYTGIIALVAESGISSDYFYYKLPVPIVLLWQVYQCSLVPCSSSTTVVLVLVLVVGQYW